VREETELNHLVNSVSEAIELFELDPASVLASVAIGDGRRNWPQKQPATSGLSKKPRTAESRQRGCHRPSWGLVLELATAACLESIGVEPVSRYLSRLGETGSAERRPTIMSRPRGLPWAMVVRALLSVLPRLSRSDDAPA
jgi:hypothetical protein